MKKKGRYSGGKKGGPKKKVAYDFYRDEKIGPVIDSPVPKKKQELKCPHCGTSSPLHDKFCTVCGKTLTKDSPSSTGVVGKVKWADNDDKRSPGTGHGRTPAAVGRRDVGSRNGTKEDKCRVCGASYANKQKFCIVCGSAREEKVQIKACLVCGAALSENEKFCTVCGSPREKKIQTKSCLVCGATIPEIERFCIVCGSSQEKYVPKKSCQFCGSVLSENERFCIVCGSSQEKYVPKKSCQFCGSVLSENERFCTVCRGQTVSRQSGTKVESKRGIKTKDRYYEILEIKPGASRAEIKKAFKRKITEYHPDKVHSLGKKLRDIAEEETKKITEAYRILMNEQE